MASTRKRKVTCVSLGERPKKILKDIESVKFVIYNFKDRNEKRGEGIVSPVAKAHGYKWNIVVYPRGTKESPTESDHVSCFLNFCQQGEITAEASLSCKNRSSGTGVDIYRSSGNSAWGFKNFLKRKDVVDKHLEEDGSLIIEAGIQIAAENKRVWYPEKLQRQDILVDLYQDATSKSSDTIFSVGGTEYAAHKLILSLRCKKLYDITQECDSDNNGPIPIHSVKEDIFKAVLDFVYTVKTPEIESEGIAIDLLVAADRYDCVPLKLYVESFIVDKFLKAENAAEWFIFADSHSCALLKETAMNLFVAHAETVKETEAWSKVEESPRLVLELLHRTTKSDKPLGGGCESESDEESLRRVLEWLHRISKSGKSESDNDNEIDCLDVTALREKLQQANLELDGSQEILVDRLKTHLKGQCQNSEN